MLTFIDLAGHEKYLKTTVFGFTGHAPHFAMLMIGANMGVYSSGAYTSGLSKYNEKLMDILADVTLNPIFPQDELDKKVKETITGLKSSSTNADAIMSDVKSAMLYGKRN